MHWKRNTFVLFVTAIKKRLIKATHSTRKKKLKQ